MRPGEIIPADEPISLNPGRARVHLVVVNEEDRPIQVGSHYHFGAVNPLLHFDRKVAWGHRLDIAAGTAVRFERWPTAARSPPRWPTTPSPPSTFSAPHSRPPRSHRDACAADTTHDARVDSGATRTGAQLSRPGACRRHPAVPQIGCRAHR